MPSLKPLAGGVGGTAAAATLSDRPGRVVGVDVARGIALIGMMAVHIFATFDRHGTPMLAKGRSATTVVLVAGVSLAFLSGGQRVVEGRLLSRVPVVARLLRPLAAAAATRARRAVAARTGAGGPR
jgi:uncharacterized membrane protein